MKAARKRGSRGTILTVDVGGSHVKAKTDAGRTKREFSSAPDLSAKATVRIAMDDFRTGYSSFVEPAGISVRQDQDRRVLHQGGRYQ